MIDHAKVMENKYKLPCPASMETDPSYEDCGPLAIITEITSTNGDNSLLMKNGPVLRPFSSYNPITHLEVMSRGIHTY